MTYTTNPVADRMSERDLDTAIRSLASGLGLRRYHVMNSQKSEPGWPDLVLVGKRGVLFRELKRQSGKPTKAQQEWLAALTEAGMDAGLWRPSCLLSGQITRELAVIAGLRTAEVPARD